MHWISIPLHVGDPICVAYGGATWQVMIEIIIGLFISVPPLARWHDCPHPGMPIADTVAKDDFWRWIAGKWYIPQQKSPRKDKSVGCPLGDGKSVGIAEHFP